MPKNQVQFQKGLSLTAFNSKYSTEEKCRERLFKARWPNGYKCPRCGHAHFYLVAPRNLYQCAHCRHQSSLISGTVFASSKLPLTTWFLGIFLVTQSKAGVSALNLRRFLGISFNAAMRMKHKLQHVMKIADDILYLKVWLNWMTPIGAASVKAVNAVEALQVKRLFLQPLVVTKRVIQFIYV